MKQSHKNFADVLQLSGGGVISIVGSGGKTTLMYRLARELSESDKTVLTTTTTKVFLPSHEQSQDVIISYDAEDVIRQTRIMLHKTRHITAANDYISETDKLTGFDSETVCKLWQSGLFHWIIVEADGSARKPLKAPADHEPVIPECTTHLVAVSGLDGVGKPLNEEWVFRSKLYMELTGLQKGDHVTPESLSVALLHKKGVMKGCPERAKKIILLNKTDVQNGYEKGREVAAFLKEHDNKGLSQIVIGSVREENGHIEVF